MLQNRRMNSPVLLAGNLEHEDVVYVVVRIEAACGFRGDVSIDLYRMPEVIDKTAGEHLQRGPGPCSPCSTIVAPLANSRSTIRAKQRGWVSFLTTDQFPVS